MSKKNKIRYRVLLLEWLSAIGYVGAGLLVFFKFIFRLNKGEKWS